MAPLVFCVFIYLAAVSENIGVWLLCSSIAFAAGLCFFKQVEASG